MSGHLILVDASGFAYRAFATSDPVHRASDGEPIGATLKFMDMLWRFIGETQHDRPTHGAAVFDPPGRTFRHTIDPQYKANRPEARSMILRGQFPFMRHVAETLGLTPVEVTGFEADDVIATLATMGRAAGLFVTIVSSDKDLGQMVVDGEIEIYDPMAENPDTQRRGRRIMAADVEAKFGVLPSLVADVQALAGDTVDNIKGVPGCGLKTAAGLARRFGPLEAVLANANEARTGALRAALKKNAALARRCLKLTTLLRDVKVPVSLDDLVCQPVLKTHLKEILRVLEAPHYMEPIFALDPQMTRLVEPVEDPDGWYSEELACPGQPVPQLPQAGFYRRRLVRNGPWVAARIWREPHIDIETGKPSGMELLRCDVGGVARDPFAQWVALASHPIRSDEYHWKLADASHAKIWRPNDPAANPKKAIDLMSAPPPVNPRKARKK